jgi:glyoxylase-like metal-dependent hydrolase (beta-lactamase superfamily II)
MLRVDGRYLVSGDTLFLAAAATGFSPAGTPPSSTTARTQLAKVPDDTVLFLGHPYSAAVGHHG